MGLFDRLKGLVTTGEAERDTQPIHAYPQQEQESPFDFDESPEEWFIASRRIEQAWEDEGKREDLFYQYGIQNESHFRRLNEAWTEHQNHLVATRGEQAWREVFQDCLNAETAAMRTQEHATLVATDPGLLEPIEGVSIQDYGRIVARMVAGQDLAVLLRESGMDQAKYDRVSEAWNQRMAVDTTFTLTGEYGKAFMPASNEACGTTETPAFSWEEYIEATEAMSAATSAGVDPQAVLKQLGMSLSDYVNAGQHWGEWFNQNAIRNPAILEEHTTLSEKYRAKYALAKNDQDLEF
ncbi:hypothetical protein [Holophaga foetida]|uniref:hypothetical protein n=1 Tax=Holophaga foetida TaxID=35839 RepID=UPI0002471D1B|nr:hypothetical protein [Holophaga foetida]